MLNQCGVYTITNRVNGKVYVGSTGKSFKVRWMVHRKALRKNTHHAKKLQHSWNKHGEENFIFAPLLICAPEHALFYEQRAMDVFASRGELYNTALGILYLKRGRYADAEKLLRAAVARLTHNYTRPRDGEALFFLGLALRRQQKHAEAEDAFQRAA